MKEDWEDYYEILGVISDSNDKKIKKVYRYKAKIFHPDPAYGSSRICPALNRRRI